MYAKFNPDAHQRRLRPAERHLRRGSRDGAITRVTHDGGDLVINGGSDWVNEEELDLHDCFRWSPDGSRIAFWQFDTARRRELSAHVLSREGPRTSSPTFPIRRPVLILWSSTCPYPLAGTTNSAVRAGSSAPPAAPSVDARPRRSAGALHRAAPVGDARHAAVQQLNRLQNTVSYLLADAALAARCARCGAIATRRSSPSGSAGFRRRGRLTEGPRSSSLSRRTAGCTSTESRRRQGNARDARRHSTRLAHRRRATRSPGGCTSSRRRTTRPSATCIARALDGRREPARVTPGRFAGTNSYDMSPDGRFAFHSVLELRRSRHA